MLVTDDRFVSGKPIVVDGAISQFSTEREKRGEVFYSIAPEEELPRVAVLSSGEELYERYVWS